MDLRIFAFVTASTLAHGAAVLWLEEQPTVSLSVGGDQRALRVALVPATRGSEVSRTKNLPAQTPSPLTDAMVSGLRPAMTVRRKPHTTQPIDPAAAMPDKARTQAGENSTPARISATTGRRALNHNAMTIPHSSTGNTSKSISAALRNQLAQHFEYPWLARKRGWQGRVLLSLRVASNGDLSEWKVVQTSGYRTLDQSALKAAQRIEHLPQAEHWLKGGSLEVRLPVQYTLLDS
jgi:protein TonB